MNTFISLSYKSFLQELINWEAAKSDCLLEGKWFWNEDQS